MSHLVRNGGFIELIIQKGKGKKVLEHIIENEKLERVIYFFTLKQLKPILSQFSFYFCREGYLDKKLLEMNWGCYLFHKKMRKKEDELGDLYK